MAELTLEQKQAKAIASARLKLKQEAEPKDPGGTMPFLNKGIAQVIGAPVDIISSGLNLVGVDTGPAPLGGSESIRKGMEAIGAPTPERDPETTGEFIGQTLGEAAGFAIPAAKGAQLLSKAPGTAGRVGQMMSEQLVAKPAATLGAEALGATGAGVGRKVAKEKDLDPASAAALELATGLGVGALPTLAKAAPSMVGAGLAKKGAKAMAFPFTEQGAMERASRRVQSLVADPEKAAQSIDDLKGSKLLPSARTEEPGLMALERAVLDRDPGELSRISIRTSDAMEELKNSVLSSGRVAKSKDFVRAKRERLSKAITARVESAADEAGQSLDAAGPMITAEDATILTRDALERSLADAKVQENMLWQAIPQEAQVPVRSTIGKFKELSGQLSSAQSGDMPASANAVLAQAADKKVTKTVVRELDGLYKKLGEEATAARASKEFNKARIAEELRESIVEDLGRAEGGGEVAETIATARAYSKEMNEKFRKGAVGKILGYSREGGPALAPELALETTIAAGGQRGELARRALTKASGDPDVMDGVQQYLKNRFMLEATQEGSVNPARAQTFLKKFDQMLGNFPELRDQLRSAVDANDVARRVKKQGDGFRRAIERESVSKTAKFLNAPVGKEISRIFQSSDPEKFMSDIVRTLKKDKTGDAMSGLKAGLSDHIIRDVQTGSLDARGRPVLNGLKLERMLKDDEFMKVIRKVYSPSDIKQWRDVAGQMAKFQKQSMVRGAKTPIITDRPAWLIDKIGQVAGAKIGAKMSGTTGGSIQSASIGSTTVRQMLNKLTADRAKQLIIDAIEDPKLMKSLLQHRPGAPVAQKRRFEKTIENWMLGAGARIVEDDEAQ